MFLLSALLGNKNDDGHDDSRQDNDCDDDADKSGGAQIVPGAGLFRGIGRGSGGAVGVGGVGGFRVLGIAVFIVLGSDGGNGLAVAVFFAFALFIGGSDGKDRAFFAVCSLFAVIGFFAVIGVLAVRGGNAKQRLFFSVVIGGFLAAVVGGVENYLVLVFILALGENGEGKNNEQREDNGNNSK